MQTGRGLGVAFFIFIFAIALVPGTTRAQTNSCPVLVTTLRQGMTDAGSGGEVSKLQTFFSGYYATSTTRSLVTGYFGSLTQASLVEFQKEVHTAVSGVVDASTRALIASACASSSAASTVSPTATFDVNPLTSLSVAPTISGTAADLNAPLKLTITTASISGAGEVVYENDAVPVANGRWSVTVAPELSEGTYALDLYANDTLLSEGMLAVGLGTLPRIIPDTSLPSYDVADGHLMRFGVTADLSGPVSIGQLSFALATSSAEISSIDVSAFDDSLYAEQVATTSLGMTDIDPSANFFVVRPDPAIEIPAGETYFFEVDGSVAPSDTAYSVTTTLLGDATASTTGTLDEMTANSNFVWSPNTYDISSTTDADWINGAVVPDLPASGIRETRSNSPATLPPVCSADASPSLVAPTQQATVTWTSTGATYMLWDDGSKDGTNGSKTFSAASSTRTFVLSFYGPYGTTVCFAAAPFSFYTPPVIATSSPPAVDNFAATPLSGTPPLLVTFSGIVNTSASCAATTYTFGYGDKSTTTIPVAAHACKSQNFTVTHSYTTVKSYTAALYRGTFAAGTTTPLLQTLVITVSSTTKKTADARVQSNLANAVSAIENWDFTTVIQGFLHIFGL